jgi:hypothetical protein
MELSKKWSLPLPDFGEIKRSRRRNGWRLKSGRKRAKGADQKLNLFCAYTSDNPCVLSYCPALLQLCHRLSFRYVSRDEPMA